uniref:BPTI/Kunitz inhibitor domain-containing protein n=1 Tax=Serinus canaria TaxID=9135 RepID=A0A8C9MFF3_SERCA
FLCPPELCSAPPVTGPCRAAFPRWFYVPAEKSCREFTYGGCRGNANNHRCDNGDMALKDTEWWPGDTDTSQT